MRASRTHVQVQSVESLALICPIRELRLERPAPRRVRLHYRSREGPSPLQRADQSRVNAVSGRRDQQDNAASTRGSDPGAVCRRERIEQAVAPRRHLTLAGQRPSGAGQVLQQTRGAEQLQANDGGRESGRHVQAELGRHSTGHIQQPLLLLAFGRVRVRGLCEKCARER